MNSVDQRLREMAFPRECALGLKIRLRFVEELYTSGMDTFSHR